jgi:hypothetical protein
MTPLPQATTYLPVRMRSRGARCGTQSARSGSPGTIRARSGSYRCPHAVRKTPVGGYKVIKKFDLRLLAGHPVRYDSFDEGETTPHETKDANEHKGTLEMAATHKGLRDSREGPEGSHRLPGVGAPIHPLRDPDTHSQGVLMKKIMVQAVGDFGLYQADAEVVAKIQDRYAIFSNARLRDLVEERGGHDSPWPRPVLEIMLAEWEVPE